MTAPAIVADAAPAGPKSRTRFALLNWGSSVAYTSATVLVAIVATPILLHYLGAERLGAYRVANEWFNYLVLAEVGLGPAFSVILFRAQAVGDARRIASTVRFALRTYVLLAVVQLPLGLLLAWSMPHLVPVSASLTLEFRIAAVVAQAALFLSPFGVFRILLETQQRGYVVVLALIVQSVVTTGTSIFLAWLGWGLIGQSVGLVLGLAGLYFIVARVAARRLMPITRVQPASIRYRDLWRLAWPFAVTGLATRLNLMTDNIVVGFALGPTTAFAFYVTQRLPQLVAAQVNGMVNATWAGLADLKAKGQHDVYETRIVELARLVIALGVTLTGTVAAYNSAFVRLWVGAPRYGGDLLSAATAAGLVVGGFQLLFAWATDIQGDARLRTKMSLSGAALNLIFSVCLAYTRLGMAGVAIGTLIAYLMTEAWYGPYLACTRYGISARYLISGCGRGLAISLPWAVGVWAFSHSHAVFLSNSPHMLIAWLGLVLECGLVGALSLCYCWICILSAGERSEWLSRFKKLRR